LRAFYACWTRKEAVVKALGLGLSVPLDQIEVGVHPALKMERLALASATLPNLPATMIDLSCDDATGALAVCFDDPSIREIEFEARLFA
jgi:4'-phosphopantetheinyl transferase